MLGWNLCLWTGMLGWNLCLWTGMLGWNLCLWTGMRACVDGAAETLTLVFSVVYKYSVQCLSTGAVWSHGRSAPKP
jgi:hypothetical protein